MEMRKSSKRQIEYAASYDKTHTIQFKLKLNKRTDADIIERLQHENNKQGYLKKLIRADIQRDALQAGNSPGATAGPAADTGGDSSSAETIPAAETIPEPLQVLRPEYIIDDSSNDSAAI